MTSTESSSFPSPRDPAPHGIAARAGRATSFLALPEVRWAALSLLAFLLALLTRVAGAPAAVNGALFVLCYAAGGWEPSLVALQALRRKSLDVDLLMIVAALAAAAIGQALDGALLIVIFSTSGALEAVATKRTQDSVRSLLTLSPSEATRLLVDGSEEIVETAALAAGDRLLVRPGERIGADGRVEDGASEVDQASITGEPLPVTKVVGDEVFAGTMNGTGALRVRVEHAAADTVVARIVALVEEASATKAKMQLFIETVEQRYSVGLVIATLGLFVIPLGFGASLQPTLLRAMTFMIVASPCAVVLATMPPLLSAIANAGRHGVLVKSAVVMEQLGHTGVVAFDKTGTLTEGTPRVAEVVVLGDRATTEGVLLQWAAAAERPSEHPLARAVVAAAHERGLSIPDAAEFTSEPGRGVTAVVEGVRVAVGSPLLLAAASHRDAATAGVVQGLQEVGRTAVVVTVDGLPAGVLGIADRMRPGAAQTVGQLAALTGRVPVLLTGDNAGAAGRLAAEVGIADVRAQLLPHDKVSAVQKLQADGTHVTLVGDGVNDAPALAAASTGVAMGRHGSDLALETADVVIVRDELATLPAVIDISRRARRVVTQNLVFAGVVITVLVGFDLAGHLPLPLGVAGHEGSTVVVGLNGLRLLAGSAWRAPGSRRPRVRRPDHVVDRRRRESVSR
ncbi:MAG: heavy metal translocating P-type ATPase [Actinomycetota bacterium]|nr:heavy metal translocating P-type ATPase [Actinomycetota bacterium]